MLFRMRAVFAVSLLASLSACGLPPLPSVEYASPELKADKASLQNKGFSDAYVAGHVDGCASGYKSAGNRDFAFAKDAPQYPDADYMQGWNKGFIVCKSRYEAYATHATPPADKE